jgi:hypothetical protein
MLASPKPEFRGLNPKLTTNMHVVVFIINILYTHTEVPVRHLKVIQAPCIGEMLYRRGDYSKYIHGEGKPCQTTEYAAQ